MDRFSLTHVQWEKMQPFCLERRPTPGELAATHDFSPKPCCGLRGPAVAGAICRRLSATGTRCSSAFVAG
jgi:hypothetical protein